MTSAQYVVELDFSRSGQFDHPLSDVSAHVLALPPLEWSVGMPSAFDANGLPVAVAPVTSCTCALDNAAGLFSPENADSPYHGLLRRGVLLRVRSLYQGRWRQHWIGKVESAKPDPALYGDAVTIIKAEDPARALAEAEYQPKLLPSATVDQAIQAMFDGNNNATVVVWPYHHRYWILGVTRLGEARIFGTTPTSFETARTTLEFVGSNADDGDGVQALQFIKDLLAAEAGGRFYWSRDGAFVFHNRLHDTLNALSADFTDDDFDAAGSDYRDGDNLINAVTLWFEPRTAGEPGTVIWSHPNLPLANPPGTNKKLTVRYSDPDDPSVRVAAVDPIDPVEGQDYDATDKEDATSDSKNKYVDVYATFHAESADLIITSADPGTNYLQTLQLRGTPYFHYSRQSVTATNGRSIDAYDRHERTLSIPAIGDEEFARQVAQSIVQRYGTPIKRFESVGFIANKSERRMEQALARTVGDRIGLRHARLRHESDYVITGERHQVVMGGEHTHSTRWILLPLDRKRYWRLGHPQDGVLGQTTRLAL